MAASEALALERLLAGTGLADKPAGLALLSGPGAKLQLASALPSRGISSITTSRSLSIRAKPNPFPSWNPRSRKVNF